MTSAAIYARVSSARQKEQETIVSQTEALRAHAGQLGLDVPEEWVFEDDGYSGASLVRPALDALRDLVAQVPVDVVLCHSPDRLARKYAYQALLMEELARAGTSVVFLKAPSGDTPEDALLVQFQGMIAEYERAQIMERTRRGKNQRARSGSVNVLSGAPFGYRYVRKNDHAAARYEVVPHEAAIVAGLFRRYADEGVAIAELARWLGSTGVTTRTGKARWDRSTIWGMLRNPAYAGRACFGKTGRLSQQAGRNRVARQAGRATGTAYTTVDRPAATGLRSASRPWSTRPPSTGWHAAWPTTRSSPPGPARPRPCSRAWPPARAVDTPATAATPPPPPATRSPTTGASAATTTGSSTARSATASPSAPTTSTRSSGTTSPACSPTRP